MIKMQCGYLGFVFKRYNISKISYSYGKCLKKTQQLDPKDSMYMQKTDRSQFTVEVREEYLHIYHTTVYTLTYS